MFKYSIAYSLIAIGALTVAGVSADGELKCIQKPTFWFVGQQTRIVIETPDDCGKLEVAHPDALDLYATWPHKAGDTTQRFYFRAQKPIEAGEMTFKSGDYSLTLPIEVLSWAQAVQPHEYDGMVFPRVFPLEGKDERKTGISFLRQEDLDELRKSGAGTPEAVAKIASELPGDDELFYMLPESTIPRAVFVSQKGSTKGCVICGRKIFQGRNAFYPWKFDFENHPFQIQCPECERWFPDNDFTNGDMTSGEYTDDGWGCIDDSGHSFCFIGYYNCWHYLNRFIPAVRNYSGLYARTGNKRIGRAVALMLFRVAEQYLSLAFNVNQRKAYMRSSVWAGKIIPQGNPGMTATWFYVEGNWEIPRLPGYATAFEYIWDYFDEEDPEFIKFLQDNYHPEIKTMQDARNFIETGYFRVFAQACLDRTVIGNHPQGQRAAMESALFLNTPRSKEIVDWTFNSRWGGMRYFLTNEYFIDGSPFESPGYNRGHVVNLQAIADVLNRIVELRPDEYKQAGFPLLTEDPKYKYLYDFQVKYSLLGRTCAHVGDSGDVAATDPHGRRPCSTLGRTDYVGPFAVYPEDTDFARVLWDPTANAPIGGLRDEKLRERVASIVTREGADLALPSIFLDGYGHAILRSGKGHDKRTLWVRWGECYGHRHDDMLTIGFEAKQRTFLPELGYPHSWTFRHEWESNRLGHYSANIIGEPGGTSRVGGGFLKLFADGGWAKIATAATRSYKNAPPAKLYEMLPGHTMERTIALVDLSEQSSYAVSIFRLRGGTDHYVSFHGPRGEASPSGLQLTAQPGGTLAGCYIPYTFGINQEWKKANPKLRAFPFLYDVEKAVSDAVWQLDWALEKYPDLHLRIHEVEPGANVALAKGKPPGGGKPYELQWAIQHRSAEQAPLSSRFTTVMEVYENEPLISEVRPLEVTTEDTSDQPPVAFEVICGDRVDTVIQCHDPTIPVTTANGVTMLGSFGIWSEVNGEMQKAFLTNGAYITKGGARVDADSVSFTGKIASANFPERKIIVEPAPEHPEVLIGCQMRITNDSGNECSHLIVGAEKTARGVELQLEYDPRIGEGPARVVAANRVQCDANLQFARWLYYHGKTLSNEDQSALYKITGASGENVYIDANEHADATKEKLTQEFVDKEGDGDARLLIYDYGPGDTVTVPNLMSVDIRNNR